MPTVVAKRSGMRTQGGGGARQTDTRHQRCNFIGGIWTNPLRQHHVAMRVSFDRTGGQAHARVQRARRMSPVTLGSPSYPERSLALQTGLGQSRHSYSLLRGFKSAGDVLVSRYRSVVGYHFKDRQATDTVSVAGQTKPPSEAHSASLPQRSVTRRYSGPESSLLSTTGTRTIRFRLP
ncbi:Uncharacterised protein [Mycobacteroides abscessus subsp. massiliense]|nr:Uncharacterised protein [Mycobacteroides abscessus subsp. massiliense]